MILAVKRGSASANLVAPDSQGLYWVAGLDQDLPVHLSLEDLVEGNGFKPTGSSNCAIRVKGKKLLSFCGPTRISNLVAQFSSGLPAIAAAAALGKQAN